MPRIAPHAVTTTIGSSYPPPFDAPVSRRIVRDISAAGGLVDVAANHVTIPPGCWSAQRHWHEGEDEIAVILQGEITLVDDAGRTPLRAGDVATFAKGGGNAHHLVNEGAADCIVLAISRPEASPVHYPDIGQRAGPGEDMHAE